MADTKQKYYQSKFILENVSAVIRIIVLMNLLIVMEGSVIFFFLILIILLNDVIICISPNKLIKNDKSSKSTIQKTISVKPNFYLSRRSFLDGIASTLDIGGRYHHYLLSHDRAVRRQSVSSSSVEDAIQSDWGKIGQDIDTATRKYGEKLD